MNLNKNQQTNIRLSTLPELSLNMLRYLMTVEKTTVKQLSDKFGTEDRETRYALDCLFDEKLVKKTTNLLDMSSIFFQHEVSQEERIFERLGVDSMADLPSHKSLFEGAKVDNV